MLSSETNYTMPFCFSNFVYLFFGYFLHSYCSHYNFILTFLPMMDAVGVSYILYHVFKFALHLTFHEQLFIEVLKVQ